MTRTELQPCGTRAAYLRHLDRGELACDPCRAANAEHRRGHYSGTRERHQAYQAARRSAARRLRVMFPLEWRKLLNEEIWIADQTLEAGRSRQGGDGAG